MGRGLGGPAREMLMWLLEKTDRELKAVEDGRTSRTLLKKYGPEYNPEMYRQEGHPNASSDKQCQTRESLRGRNLVVPYPAKGHVKRLLLTAEGREYATFLREWGGCSPGEIDRATRKSSCLNRLRLDINKSTLKHKDLALKDEYWLWDQEARLRAQVEIRERNCREYIRNLPPELMKSEAKRIAEEGWEEPPPPIPEFTDGAPDTQSAVTEREPDGVLN